MVVNPRRIPLLLAFLLLLPTAIYWNTIFHRFGFRDDYSIMREAREEPGKVMRLCTSMARPIYGFILEKSYAQLKRIGDFGKVRLFSAALFGLVAVVLFFVLRQHGWDPGVAALIAGLVTLLPGSQVSVAWAVAWPPVLALLLAVGGYSLAERSFGARSIAVRLGWWLPSLATLAASVLTYQANSLFYVVPFAAGLISKLELSAREIASWVVRHVVTFGVAGAIACTIVLQIFASGAAPMSSRVAFAPNLRATFNWFFHFPLPNALALFALEAPGEYAVRYHAAIMLVAILLLAGVIAVWRQCGWRRGVLYLVAMGLLPFAAYAVNLVSTERLPTYRTLIALSGLVLVLVAGGLMRAVGRRWTVGILVALFSVAAWTAHRQAFELIARPQALELSLLEDAVSRVDLGKRPRIFVITPYIAEGPSKIRIGDEFGSLSSNSDWVSKEMLGVAMRERWGEVSGRYTIECGLSPPLKRPFNLVIDMGRLREFQER